jgi:hypothetical protein
MQLAVLLCPIAAIVGSFVGALIVFRAERREIE